MSDPLLRQWELLKLIPRERKTTVKTLHGQLEALGYSVTRRTLERDLEKLSLLFPLEADTRSKPYGWRFAIHMSPIDIPGLTSSEALTLVLLETHLKILLPVAVADNLAPHFAAARQSLASFHPDVKLRDWLKKVMVVSPGQPLLPSPMDATVQRVVYEALLQGYQLTMDYLPAGSTESRHYQCVHLQGLVQYGHVIYLVTTINDHQDIRLLSLHRIQQAAILEAPLQLLADFDLQTYIDQGGLGFGEQATTIKLTAVFKNGAGNHLVDTPLSEDQQLERLDAQTLQVTASVLETPKLIWWLTSFGPDIEVQSPIDLRMYLYERHRQAAECYANNF